MPRAKATAGEKAKETQERERPAGDGFVKPMWGDDGRGRAKGEEGGWVGGDG